DDAPAGAAKARVDAENANQAVHDASLITRMRVIDKAPERSVNGSYASHVSSHTQPSPALARIDIRVAARSRLAVGLRIRGPAMNDRHIAVQSDANVLVL